MTGEHSCSQQLIPEVLVQVSWAGQTHRYFWTAAEPAAVSSPPAVSGLSAWGVCSRFDSGSRPALPAPPMTPCSVFPQGRTFLFLPGRSPPVAVEHLFARSSFPEAGKDPRERSLVMWPQVSEREGALGTGSRAGRELSASHLSLISFLQMCGFFR